MRNSILPHRFSSSRLFNLEIQKSRKRVTGGGQQAMSLSVFHKKLYVDGKRQEKSKRKNGEGTGKLSPMPCGRQSG
jgi:hypothetical protein